MDLTACTMTTHGLIPASLQPAPAPGLNGRTAILCPAKTSPWETIVTHLPHHPPPPCILSSPPPPLPPPEIPKESIIANTDFTTTSVIAKRRLSSKKRRQQQQQQSQGLSSPNKDAHTTLSDDATSRSATTNTTNSSPSSSAQSSTTLTHPIAGSIGGVGPSHVMAVPAPQYVHVPVAASMSLPHNDQVLSQLQLPHQYQLVQQQDTTQKQVLYCKNVKEESTVRQQESHCQPSSNQPTTSKDFKWSNAHVFIAKRIQDHQKQLQLQEQQKLHQQRIEQQQKLHQQRMEQQVIQQQQQQLQHQQTQLQLRQLQQQQQQQYALLHVYGCLPNAHPPHAPGTASVISLADIHQQHPQQVCVSGLPLVQPASSQVLGLLPQGVGLHAGGIPLAVAQPADLQAYVASQGMGGSWVGPTVPIVGSCVVNPLQPAATGLLATTSWVK